MIRGRVPQRPENIKLLRQEYGIGDYQRVFAIGALIAPEDISAGIHIVVLIVYLPKTKAV